MLCVSRNYFHTAWPRVLCACRAALLAKKVCGTCLRRRFGFHRLCTDELDILWITALFGVFSTAKMELIKF
jgi:hypothetical protein